VIDPGPDDAAHLAALKRAIEGLTVDHIVVTHTHRDHSPAARALKAWTGAKTYGFGPHRGTRDEGHLEEGGDFEFVPDIRVADRERIAGKGYTLECLHTPGHTSNHVCYALEEERAVFTGDHVMGWATSVVIPPDGDMADYMESLKRMTSRQDRVYWPTHGAPVVNPVPYVEALIAHRVEREEQVVSCLARGVRRIRDMVAAMYADVDPRLHPAAAMSVLAHLIKLVREGRAIADGEPNLSAEYGLA
jgi:glyoxylase-like metal-dependent hydrolase (beta-lactamase superfamily II)